MIYVRVLKIKWHIIWHNWKIKCFLPRVGRESNVYPCHNVSVSDTDIGTCKYEEGQGSSQLFCFKVTWYLFIIETSIFMQKEKLGHAQLEIEVNFDIDLQNLN